MNVQNTDMAPVRKTLAASPGEEERALCGRMVTGLSRKAGAQKRVPNHRAWFALQQSQAAEQKLARTAMDTFSAAN